MTGLALGVGLAAATSAQAASYLFGFTSITGVHGTISLNGLTPTAASQSGWFDSVGTHQAANSNNAVSANFTPSLHDYATFTNLFGLPLATQASSSAATNLSAAVTSATISFDQPSNGFALDAGAVSVTYTLYDVTTLSPTSVITATAFTGRTDIYADLGSGISYGSVTVSSYSPIVSIVLNDAGLAALNASGGNFIVGGALTENLAAVPEPATWALLIAGFAMTGAALRRRTAALA